MSVLEKMEQSKTSGIQPIPIEKEFRTTCCVTLYPDRYRFSIAGAVEAVWQHYSGTGDYLIDDDLEQLIQWLRNRLKEWTPGSSRSLDYDNAWRILIKECIKAHEDKILFC